MQIAGNRLFFIDYFYAAGLHSLNIFSFYRPYLSECCPNIFECRASKFECENAYGRKFAA